MKIPPAHPGSFLTFPLCAATLATASITLLTPTVGAQRSQPFPDPIATSTFAVEVTDFATIPSRGTPPRVHHLTSTPDGRIFVVDQEGLIFCMSADGRAVTPYLDVRDVPGIALITSSEQGLQGLAFHPDFSKTGAPGYGKFYTAHTTSNQEVPADFSPGQGHDAGDCVVVEWHAANPEKSGRFQPANPESPYRELMRFESPFGNHSIGLVAFNPNAAPSTADYGKLYVGLGDGGAGGDPFKLASNPTDPHGKILRIDPLGTDGRNGHYGIPADNPFAGGRTGPAGALPEIFAYGLRNPQRFSWDRGGRHEMFIGDIGQNLIEEINRGVPGANYGWNTREGSFAYRGGDVGENLRADAATTGLTYPVVEYDHSQGNCITAGFVERTGRIAELSGKFLFGDLARGHVYFFDADTLPEGGQAGITQLRLVHQGVERSFLDIIRTVNPDADRADLRFGTDFAGRIFLYNKQDGIIRLLGSASST